MSDNTLNTMESKKQPKLVKVTLQFDDGHKLVRSKEHALPFLISLVKELSKKSQ